MADLDSSTTDENNLVNCDSRSDHPMEMCAGIESPLPPPDPSETDTSSASREAVEETAVTNEKKESDFSWMSRGFDHVADDCEAKMNAARIKTLKANITRKGKQNKPCYQDEVDLMKAKIEVEGHERRSRGRKQILGSDPDDNHDSLFLPHPDSTTGPTATAELHEAQQSQNGFSVDEDREPTRDSHDQEPSPEDEALDEEDEFFCMNLVNKMANHLALPSQNTSKKVSTRPKTAKHVRKHRLADGSIEAPRKRSKRSAGMEQRSIHDRDDAGKKGSADRKPAMAGKKKRTRKQLPSKPSDALIGLLYSNTIQDRMDQEALGPAPNTFGTKVKRKMLAALVASVPADVNKRLVFNDRKEVLKASCTFGPNKIKPTEEGRWLLKGMKTSLIHHQLLGTSWMVTREGLQMMPRGGIVADTMGTGKTLQTLATMVGNPHDPMSKESKTTLLVVPSSLLSQWLDEIKKHVEEKTFSKILVYKARYRLSMANLNDQDIILCTYTELSQSYPWPSVEEKRMMKQLDMDNFLVDNWEQRGDLLRMEFYRVVIDEGHAIKNWQSRTSLACQSLSADRRWVLSGTPVMNNLSEFFAYFRFLRIPQAVSYPDFKKDFCNPKDPLCYSRIVHFLSFMMIRRTLRCKIFDRPIVELPPTHPAKVKVKLDSGEKFLYKVIQRMFRSRFNVYLASGSMERKYQNCLVMLLRLRQATCHPYLLKDTIINDFTPQEFRELEAELKTEIDSPLHMSAVGRWAKACCARRHEEDAAQVAKPPRSEHQSRLDESATLDRDSCLTCHDIAVNPRITDCQHVFCEACIQRVCDQSAERGLDTTSCPHCGKIFLGSKRYTNQEAQPTRASVTSAKSSPDSRSQSKGAESGSRTLDWLDGSEELLSSAKLAALKTQISTWLREAPEDKIVVFTQFHLMVNIIARLCQKEKWTHLLYTGEMSPETRHNTQRDFQEATSTVQIMIAGLKCGGQGLNLTAANRVISVDLWWNHSVELQAFGRVFRFGQKKETHFCRIVATDTVDDRMLRIQEEKIRIVDTALMDNDKRVKKLTIAELASLFGTFTNDKNGTPVILEDGADDDDHNDGSSADEAEKGMHTAEDHEGK